jgi:hypothetical protein
LTASADKELKTWSGLYHECKLFSSWSFIVLNPFFSINNSTQRKDAWTTASCRVLHQLD